MNKSLIKLTSLLLILTIFTSLSIGNNAIAESTESNGITIISDNDLETKSEITFNGIKGTLKLDKINNTYTLLTDEVSDITGIEGKTYSIDVFTATIDRIDATFTDIETGEQYSIDTGELKASFAFLIPIGIIIGEILLSHLISIGLAIVIGSITYIAYSEFQNREKTYNHYMALRTTSGLFIGNGLSKAAAISRLKSLDDTWSTSQTNAQVIAKEASPLLKAVGPEIDKNGTGKHYHYHPVSNYSLGIYERLNVHAFYGTSY